MSFLGGISNTLTSHSPILKTCAVVIEEAKIQAAVAAVFFALGNVFLVIDRRRFDLFGVGSMVIAVGCLALVDWDALARCK